MEATASPKCNSCGAETKWYASSGKPKRWCSAACRDRDPSVRKQYIHRCVDCGLVRRTGTKGSQRCMECHLKYIHGLRRAIGIASREKRYGYVECPVCGEMFLGKMQYQNNKSASRPKLFCSRRCAHQVGVLRRQSDKALTRSRIRRGSERLNIIVKKMCRTCDKRFVISQGKYKLFCCEDCRSANMAHRRHVARSRIHGCVVCGAAYVGVSWVYCSEICRKKKEKQQRRIDRARRAARMSARKRGWIIDAEPIDPLAVFDNCLWLCGICGERVDHKQRMPHPLGAEMDHVVPLSKGGQHVRKNVQLTHSVCNNAKRDGRQEDIVSLVRGIKDLTGWTVRKSMAGGW